MDWHFGANCLLIIKQYSAQIKDKTALKIVGFVPETFVLTVLE